jgi:hypothetical protein
VPGLLLGLLLVPLAQLVDIHPWGLPLPPRVNPPGEAFFPSGFPIHSTHLTDGFPHPLRAVAGFEINTKGHLEAPERADRSCTVCVHCAASTLHDLLRGDTRRAHRVRGAVQRGPLPSPSPVDVSGRRVG